MSTPEIVSALAAGAVSAGGIVKLWAFRMQHAQDQQGEKITDVATRVARLEAYQAGLDSGLKHIEALLGALDGRMTTMVQELGRLGGRMEGR